LRYGLLFFLNVDIRQNRGNGTQRKPCGILKALAKFTKQSLNPNEPKIAAPDILKHFESQNTSKNTVLQT
jgi:hypothetical protein